MKDKIVDLPFVQRCM